MLNSPLKLFTSKILIIISLLFSLSTKAQKTLTSKLIPDQAIIQYAGSIGYLSAGIGYNLFKERSTLSFHYGHVPLNKGGELNILAVKFDYKPISIKIKDQLIFRPINPLFFLSYTLGKDFGLKFDQNQYAKGYYFWSPALREHIGINSEIEFLGDKNSTFKSISVYAEANTNDLYLISWYENRTSTPIYDIFHLGLGLKFSF
jgi:hypothetical protein